MSVFVGVLLLLGLISTDRFESLDFSIPSAGGGRWPVSALRSNGQRSNRHSVAEVMVPVGKFFQSFFLFFGLLLENIQGLV